MKLVDDSESKDMYAWCDSFGAFIQTLSLKLLDF
jgi:hypothetical protein